MSRYFVARRALWVEDDEAWDAHVSDSVPTVCDHEATDTGLVDINGDAIMRAPNLIGFGKDDEW